MPLKIVKIEMGLVRIPLITPFKTALRTVEHVEDILLRLTAESGEAGYGEAPPTKAITGETLESIQAALTEKILPAMMEAQNRTSKDEADRLETLLRAVQNACGGNSSAKAAADMALFDLAAREAGEPLYRFLAKWQRMHGDSLRTTLLTDLTISVNPVPQMAEDARIAVRRGFRDIKIKVGKEGEHDLERIAAIREAVGSQIGIRVDANQGWTPEEAVRILTAAEERGLGLAFVEQPVGGGDLAGMAYVKAHTHTMVVADESMFHPEDAQAVFERQAADLVNIKLMKAGGLYEACRIAAIARSFGKKCMIGCMLESKIAVSAAAHFAAASEVVTAIDLDGPSLCAADPYAGGPLFDGPRIVMNETAGLGIEDVDASYMDGWRDVTPWIAS